MEEKLNNTENLFKKYILEIKKTMYERYENAKKNVARHNIAMVDVDHEVWREYFEKGLTPLQAIKEIEMDNDIYIP